MHFGHFLYDLMRLAKQPATLSALTAVAVALVLGCPAVAASDKPATSQDDIIDSPMYTSPNLTPRMEMVFPKGARELWLKALQRPEAEVKCKAADAIARAHRQGVNGFEAAVAPLLATLDQPEQHPSVRVAAARALAALDAREAAPELFRHAQAGDSDLRDAIEPVLARWDYRPMRAVWLERLGASAPGQRSLVLAIRGLATVRDEQAVRPLRGLALSERSDAAVRLEAARSLALLRDDGLEHDGETLSADNSPAGIVARLVAASLLQRHSSAAAIRLLQHLALDNEPAVSALAIERLLALDAKLVVPSLGSILASPDAKVRALGVEVLFREPTARHIEQLRDRLDEPHPDVRVKARRALHDLAGKNEWRERVLAEAIKALATRQWRCLEQATILLTQLDQKAAARRFIELLNFERPEVFVAAAWGLRNLAVPETLPAAASHIETTMRRLSAPAEGPSARAVPMDMIDHQFSQLNQFLGRHKYSPAEALLRRFIPKPMTSGLPVGSESRAAAVWALGMIHEGKSVPDSAVALEERLNDTTSIPPEDTRVRWMCALTLGRIQAKDAVPSLRRHYPFGQPANDPVNNACGWAIEQITGEKMPPRTIRKVQRDWFLIPRE